MDEITDTTAESTNRRQALKMLGVGAAGAWAAPTVIGIGSAAAASSLESCENPFHCADGDPGFEASFCRDDGSCYCIKLVDGGTACMAGLACSGEACDSNADCGPGGVCQAPDSGCCGQQCIYGLCGETVKAPAKGAPLNVPA